MRILTIHNKYQYRGGEDEVYEAEERLLQSRGHLVRPLIFDNAGIEGFGAVRTGLTTPWCQASYRRVADEIRSWRPDILNVHNFFPLATPAVYYAAKRARTPVVQTLHNFRILCVGATLLREGSPCETCFGKLVPWPGIVHKCYRGSYAASAAVAAMSALHNALKTWQSQVSLFFALTEFSRRKFMQGGLPPERLVVKPNFVPSDLGPGPGDGGFVLYAGRLSEGKGIPLLLNAWQAAKPPGRLLLAGDGPLAPLVRRVAGNIESIEYLGLLPWAETHEIMGRARALVFPSLCYEGMPRAIIEAFSRGTPAIAARAGSMAEMVRHRETGWLVDSGDCGALAGALSSVLAGSFEHTRIRAAARAEYERNYTADRQYGLLMDAYQRAIEMAHWQ
jgi:glycosyltransferase involved in cell wall biosynthesis